MLHGLSLKNKHLLSYINAMQSKWNISSGNQDLIILKINLKSGMFIKEYKN